MCQGYFSALEKTRKRKNSKTIPSKLEILKQLLNGNHLEKEDLERAKHLIKSLEINIKTRVV